MPMESRKSIVVKQKPKNDSKKQGGRVKGKAPLKHNWEASEKDTEILRLRRQVDDLKGIIREKLFGNEGIGRCDKEQDDDAISCRTAYIDCDEFSDDTLDTSSDEESSNESETTVVESVDDLQEVSTVNSTPNSGVFEKLRKTVRAFSKWGSSKHSFFDSEATQQRTENASESCGDFNFGDEATLPREISKNTNLCHSHSNTPCTRRLQHPDDEEFKSNKCIEAASRELKELTHLIKWHENRIAEAQKKYECLQSEGEGLHEQIKQGQAGQEFKCFMKRIISLKTELDEIAGPNIEIAAQADKIQDLKFEAKDKAQEIKKLKEQLQRALTACHDKHSLIHDMGTNIKKLKEEVNQRKLKIAELKKDLLRASAQIQRLKKVNEELLETMSHTEKSTTDIAKYSVWQAYNCKLQFKTKYSKATAMLEAAEEKISGLFTALEELLRRACDFYVSSNFNNKQIPKELSIAMASTILQVDSKEVEYLLEKKNEQKPCLWITCCKKLSNTEGFPNEMSGLLFEVLKIFFTGSFFESKT